MNLPDPVLGLPSAEARLAKLIGSVTSQAAMHRRIADDYRQRHKEGLASLWIFSANKLDAAIREVA